VSIFSKIRLMALTQDISMNKRIALILVLPIFSCFAISNSVHPLYNVINLQPPEFYFAVGGIDFLSDGRIVICDWGRENVEYGKVYILENASFNDDIANIKVKQFAEKIREPLGIKVIHDSIYVLGKDALYLFPDVNKDDRADRKAILVTGWPWIGGREYAFGLQYRDGAFFGTFSSQIPPNAPPWNNLAADVPCRAVAA
jgi:cytochrome c